MQFGVRRALLQWNCRSGRNRPAARGGDEEDQRLAAAQAPEITQADAVDGEVDASTCACVSFLDCRSSAPVGVTLRRPWS